MIEGINIRPRYRVKDGSIELLIEDKESSVRVILKSLNDIDDFIGLLNTSKQRMAEGPTIHQSEWLFATVYANDFN